MTMAVEEENEIVLEPESLEVEDGIEDNVKPEEVEAEPTEDAIDNPEDKEEEDDEVIVTIGEDSPPQEEEQKAPAPEWVKELRKSNRELQKENKSLKAKQEAEATENKPVVLGKKPTLEGLDYDSDAYDRDLSAWYERKREHEDAEEAKKSEQEEQSKAWQVTVNGYEDAKKVLKVRDFEEAEYTVQETLSDTQQGMILQGADNAALVVYALGKNPKRAKEIASIKDPVKFAFAVAKLETTLKVNSRRIPPPPEKTVSGTGSLSGTVDKTLDRLRAEASKTGNFSKVVAYKKSKKA